MLERPRGTAALITLGCKVNQCDSAAMAAALERDGWRVLADADDDAPDSPDLIIVNSCAVTARAAAKSRQAARAAARRFPGSKVVLAGCYPQVLPDEAAGVSGLAAIAGTGRQATLAMLNSLIPKVAPRSQITRANPDQRLANGISGVLPELPLGFETLPAAMLEGRVRAYLKVQEGCEAGCAYCVVPLARGPQRSLPLEHSLTEARRLIAGGARELVLTGIRLGAYGRDLADSATLPELVRALAQLDGLVRLRLSSLEPVDLTPALLAAVADAPCICRHLHLPLQSGSDKVLRQMGRGYDTAEYTRLLEEARRALPGLAVSTDVMAGFPGETETDHQASMEYVRQASFSRLHVFPYSARPGTAAASFPDHLPRRIKEERVRALVDLGASLAERHHQTLVGAVLDVLLETEPLECDDGNYQSNGLTGGYVRVQVRLTRPAAPGTLVGVMISSAGTDGLRGHPPGSGISCHTQHPGESCNQ